MRTKTYAQIPVSQLTGEGGGFSYILSFNSPLKSKLRPKPFQNQEKLGKITQERRF